MEAGRAVAAGWGRGSVRLPADSAGISNPTSARVERALCLASATALPKAPMIKSELILKIAEQNPHLYEQDAADIVNAILDTIADALARGERVELRGFGAFTAKRRGARAGRNPRSGAVVAVSEKVLPMFKMSREMLRRLNPGEGEG